MTTYIALLRGINVSGQKKILMADLKKMFIDLGYQEVVTYIQSGNVIFQTKKTAEEKLEKNIKSAIEKTFGFDVPVFVLTRDELKKLSDNNPYKDRPVASNFIFLTILSSAPEDENIEMVQAMEFPGEEFSITKRVVYLCLPNGAGRSKLTNNFFEKKLKVRATSRNMRSVLKLLNLSE